MGCRVLEGKMDGGEQSAAVLYDSTSGYAFGPLFDDADTANDFIAWCQKETNHDPRHHNGTGTLEDLVDLWRKERAV